MGDGNDEDRISKLPNGVIHHMMSFLPTKDVVRTCLLSKRWKLIWYSVPTLSFSDHIEVEGRQEFYTYIEKYLEHRKRDFQPSLEALICDIPLLENLNLSYYPSPLDYRLRISSQHLKSFTFEFLSGGLIHVEIESAPKLEYFCYKGDVNFSISMESSNSINGKIVIHEKEELDYDRKWFTDLIIFLANLNCSWNIVTLHVSTYKALIWPENLKNICRSSLLNWKHLRVITDCLPEKESELKEGLMWISPSLDSLSINENVVF